MKRPWSPAVWFGWLAAVGACGFSPDGGRAPDAVDAAVDAPCVPGCNPAGDEAITCDGGHETATPCAYGCIDDPGAPVCARTLVPSNVDPATLTKFSLADVQGGIPFTAGTRFAIDTDSGTIWEFPPIGQAMTIRTGEGLSNNIGFQQVSATMSVLGVLELRVVAGSTLEIYGTRGLVILAKLDAIIDGRVRADGGLCDSVAKRLGCNGAGGGWGAGELTDDATGCAPGGNGQDGTFSTGGGGGGMATAGANGGTSDISFGGVAASDLSACAGETLVPLAGGGGGGSSPGAVGGGGGGALQITAYGTMRVSATGVVTAVGSGGEGTTSFDDGGGGGGAGGAILLEGESLDVGAGTISVAGGGGGGGRFPGNDGQSGRTDGQPALGGLGDGPGMVDGLGGNGAIDSVAALPGRSNATGNLDGTGGGGGGLGRIRVNSVRGDTARGSKFVGRYTAGRTTRGR
ncbi:MAG TPA: hypothetical protein VHE35_28700 [Kofleriaceae bacterium]|nr:hypothetical protein [Kofleriaceae bacterium]